MKKPLIRTLAAVGLLPLTCGFLLDQCGGLTAADFKPACRNGFGLVDNARDYNGYPWSMAYFVPDGAENGHVYVGTGNGITELIFYLLGAGEHEEVPAPPPEIRRHRPDRGRKTWERVFDYRDIEDGPRYTSFGFRNMAVYRAQSDGINYLYASTYGKVPTIWRSATGDPGAWELLWSSGNVGSIRWLAPHNGLLYIAISNELVLPPTPGAIWATDGDAIWPVMEDGFGKLANHSVMSLISHNDWLYAGTSNPITGYEIWKLEGPGGEGPVKVVDGGGGDRRNQAACMPIVFQNKLYWGTMIFPGTSLKGCDIIRIHDDAWQYIVGPDGLSGYDSGFTKVSNTYLWWMVEHNGWLYAGTFDADSALQAIVDNAPLFPEVLKALPGLPERFAQYAAPVEGAGLKRAPSLLSRWRDAGADLYKSPDGAHWYPVFTDGLGDPYNWGLRTMVSVGDDLYIGMANPFDGLEVWRGSCKLLR